jgi:AraC family transcriptional regulator
VTSRLNRINRWNKLAELSRYSVRLLAKKCEATPRHLERYFLNTKGCSPHDWLEELRLKRAKVLIRKGFGLKEVAAELQYSHPNNFSRAFKRFHGTPPSASA